MLPDDAAVRSIVRSELARARHLEQVAGIVSSTDPLTVTLNSGAVVHISHRPVGMTLVEGTKVEVRFTGETYLVENVITAAGDTGDGPSHTHTQYAADVHTHPAFLGWHYLTTLTTGGASNTIAYTLPSGYKHFEFITVWDYDSGTAAESVYVRLNSDAGANYNRIHHGVQGDAPNTFNGDYQATSDHFFARAGSLRTMGAYRLTHAANDAVGWFGDSRSRGGAASNQWHQLLNGVYLNGPATSIRFLIGAAAGGGSAVWSADTEIDVLGLKVA